MGAFTKRLKFVVKGVATLAILSFGFQSIALPVHTAVHAVERSVQFARSGSVNSTTAIPAGSHSQITESDCDLCDLASHQAIQRSLIVHFETAETVTAIDASAPSREIRSRLAKLPPVRGPPTHA